MVVLKGTLWHHESATISRYTRQVNFLCEIVFTEDIWLHILLANLLPFLHLVVEVMDQPARRPNINPIENVWDQIIGLETWTTHFPMLRNYGTLSSRHVAQWTRRLRIVLAIRWGHARYRWHRRMFRNRSRSACTTFLESPSWFRMALYWPKS